MTLNLKKDANPEKTVYILGAGSSIAQSIDSKAEKLPNITEIFKTAKKLGVLEEIKYQELQDFVKSVTDRDIYIGTNRVNAEDILTLLEVNRELGIGENIEIIKEQFLNLIILLFQKLSDIILKKGSLVNLVNNLNSKDTLITFNWDLLVDNLLGRWRRLHHYYPNYIKLKNSHPNDDFRYTELFSQTAQGQGTFGNITLKPPHFEQVKTNGFYLKLHGSIDWRYCINVGCRGYGKAMFVSSPLENKWRCPECHELLKPLIVPPILNKQISKTYFIRRMWTLAAEELKEANKIVIWGYSLPPTDFYSKWLLLKMRENNNISNVSIINPSVLKENNTKLNYKFIDKFYDMLSKGYDKSRILLYDNFGNYSKNRTVDKFSNSIKQNYKTWMSK